jgi:hypothetical protein
MLQARYIWIAGALAAGLFGIVYHHSERWWIATVAVVLGFAVLIVGRWRLSRPLAALDLIHLTEQNQTLRLEWDYRTIIKSHALFDHFCWACLFVCACFCSNACLIGPLRDPSPWDQIFAGIIFGSCWSGLLLLCIVGSVFKMLTRYRREWIEITTASIVHGYEGPLKPVTRAFPHQEKSALYFNRTGLDNEDYVQRRLHLYEFGEQLPYELKAHIFATISAFVQAQQIPLACQQEID